MSTSPLQEVLVLASVGEAGPPHTQVLHQPQVLDLVADEEVIKLAFGEEERLEMLPWPHLNGGSRLLVQPGLGTETCHSASAVSLT